MGIPRIRPNQAIAIRAHGERNRPVSRAAKSREEIGQPSDHVDERTKAKPAFIGLAMIRQKVVIMRLRWSTESAESARFAPGRRPASFQEMVAGTLAKLSESDKT